MRRVISFSLFDNIKYKGRYNHLLPALIRGYISLFPGWELWFYHDESLFNSYYGSVLLGLQETGHVSLFCIPGVPRLCKAMLWRMRPLWEKDVEYFLCRDIDHTPTGRERNMVEVFIQSKEYLHCINDNPAHDIPILGGMIGFKVKETLQFLGSKSFDDFISSSGFSDTDWENHGSDQQFLNSLVWVLLKSHSCLHRLRWDLVEPLSRHCYFHIDTVEVKDVSKILIEQSENFCTCIGTPPISNNDYIKFIDEHGPQDKLKLIREVERELGYLIGVL